MENKEKIIKQLVSEFLVHLGIDFGDLDIEKINESEYRINVASDSPNLLIGHHGENLQAMQKILKVIFHKQLGEEINIGFDVDNYRKRQEENVLTITEQKIQEVLVSRGQVALPPMSAYFRRLVHLFIRENHPEHVATESMGEGNYRQVVIKYKA